MESLNRIPRLDKLRQHFEIGIYDASDFLSLLEMYRTFSPRPASQGLPPEDPETCERWVKKLLTIGESLLAWREDRVIGHAALVPDRNERSGEFVIFVDRDHRNHGIGTALTGQVIEGCRKFGFDSVWLTVDVSNYTAIKLYRKMGFEYSDMADYERTMILRL